MKTIASLLCLALAISANCQQSKYSKLEDGVVINLTLGGSSSARLLKLQVLNNRVIHVTATPNEHFPNVKSLMAVGKGHPAVKWNIKETENEVVLQTSQVAAHVLLGSGEVYFTDSTQKVILQEKKGGGKTFTPVKTDNESSFAIQQVFESPSDEAFYGLGQHQLGFMNYKGKDVTLAQYNTKAVIPFVVSDRNYGILWDNNSITKFGDPRDYEPISSLKLYSQNGILGGLTARYVKRNNPGDVFLERTENSIEYEFLDSPSKMPQGFDSNNGMVLWDGFIEPTQPGLNKFSTYSAGYTKIWIDGKLLVDNWRQAWNAVPCQFELAMEQGKRYPIKIEWIPDGGESILSVKCLGSTQPQNQNKLILTSEAGDQLDYYFIYGENMDKIISGYRQITGKSPIMPKWAMGFWQSRERYKTQDELLSVVKGFRTRHIPIDNIVLDWQYWKPDSWGTQEFDSARFSSPSAMITDLHQKYNTRLMISVWPKFYVTTKNYQLLNSKGWLYKKNIENNQKDWLGYVSTFYDAFNPMPESYFGTWLTKVYTAKE